jgi:YfiH family protein
MKSLPEDPRWISAYWPAPACVKAVTTTRVGGLSKRPYDGFNLADHVGDDDMFVKANRHEMMTLLDLKNEPVWLMQEHGNKVVDAGSASNGTAADGIYTDSANVACGILTADCVPVLLCDNTGTEIAAIHAGWRGLCKGILIAAIDKFICAPDTILAWIGPHIGKASYEVRMDMRDTCIESLGIEVKHAFERKDNEHFYADLERMVRLNLQALGVVNISTSGYCSYKEPDLFYSHRRNGRTGRMASLIWITN